MPDNRHIQQVIEERREQGELLSYADGQWYALNAATMRAEALSPERSGHLDRRIRELETAEQHGLPPDLPEQPDEATAQAIEAARLIVAEREGRYYWKSGWRAIEGGRRTGRIIPLRERQRLELAVRRQFFGVPEAPAQQRPRPEPQPEAPPETPPEPGAFTTRDVAGQLGISPTRLLGVAHRIGVGQRTATGYRFTPQDVEALREELEPEPEEEEAEEEPEGTLEPPPTRQPRSLRKRWGRGPSSAMLINDLVGMPLHAGIGLARTGVGTGTQLAQGLTSFLTDLLSLGLVAAGGASGAGLARIGSGLVGLLTQSLTAGATGVLTVGTALVDLMVGGLRLVGSVASFAVGGALLGLFGGAIGAMGSALGESVGRMVGAVSHAAEESLQGVVGVLRDLTTTARQFSDAGVRLRGIGGMQTGQELQTLLFGRATGVDLTGMFGQWRMRPEFAQPRFGALGVQYNPQDVTGSVVAALEVIRNQPGLLQLPLLNMLTGGQGTQLMPLLQLPRERLLQARDTAGQLEVDPALLQRVFGDLQPALNRISTIFLGLKLEVLDATLPSIMVATRALERLWTEHRGDIRRFMQSLPDLISRGIQAILSGGIAVLQMGERVYIVLRNIYDWFVGNVWPVLSGIGRAIADRLGISVAGPATATGASTPAAGQLGGQRRADGTLGPGADWPRDGGRPDHLRDVSYQRTQQVLNAGNWMWQHPWQTAAIGIGGPMFLRGVLGAAGRGLVRGGARLFGRGTTGAAAGERAAVVAEEAGGAARGAGWLGRAWQGVRGGAGGVRRWWGETMIGLGLRPAGGGRMLPRGFISRPGAAQMWAEHVEDLRRAYLYQGRATLGFGPRDIRFHRDAGMEEAIEFAERKAAQYAAQVQRTVPRLTADAEALVAAERAATGPGMLARLTGWGRVGAGWLARTTTRVVPRVVPSLARARIPAPSWVTTAGRFIGRRVLGPLSAGYTGYEAALGGLRAGRRGYMRWQDPWGAIAGGAMAGAGFGGVPGAIIGGGAGALLWMGAATYGRLRPGRIREAAPRIPWMPERAAAPAEEDPNLQRIRGWILGLERARLEMDRQQREAREQRERAPISSMLEGMREGFEKLRQSQERSRELGTLRVLVLPSPEFAPKMELLQSQHLYRSLQVAMA